MFSFFDKTREVSETQFREMFNKHQGHWVTHDTGTFSTNRQYLVAVDANGDELANTVANKFTATARYADGGSDVFRSTEETHALPDGWEEVYAIRRVTHSSAPNFRKLVARNNHDGTVQVFHI